MGANTHCVRKIKIFLNKNINTTSKMMTNNEFWAAFKSTTILTQDINFALMGLKLEISPWKISLMKGSTIIIVRMEKRREITFKKITSNNFHLYCAIMEKNLLLNIYDRNKSISDEKLSGWQDSNLRPLRPERSALPTAPHPVQLRVQKYGFFLILLHLIKTFLRYFTLIEKQNIFDERQFILSKPLLSFSRFMEGI